MKVTLKGIKDRDAFDKAGIALPDYDVARVQATSRNNPVWLHFGAGNIFRGYIASLQHDLLSSRSQTSGIITLSTHDGAEVDRVLSPHDRLTLETTVLRDGTLNLRVTAAIANSYKLNGSSPADEYDVRALATRQSIQMISYTITEKGYVIRDIKGNFLPEIKKDIESGPVAPGHTVSWTAALLWERWQAGAAPVAMVSFDNCSENGNLLRDAVLTIAREWESRGFVNQAFIRYLSDEDSVTFPNTMIDRITPYPDRDIAARLTAMGIEDMEVYTSKKGAHMAPFVNMEKSRYLVIEDKFPNGRPQLEKVGVLFTTARGVQLFERMKVSACLNPLQTALALYGCIFGYEHISDAMNDRQLINLIRRLGYEECLRVVDSPMIVTPREYLNEIFKERLTNRALPDTPARIATDTSQKIRMRFGYTISAYQKRGYALTSLVALPLALAGWLRYLMAIDDNGHTMKISDDPMLSELSRRMSEIIFTRPDSVERTLRPLLSNETVFGQNLYEAGIGQTVENLFKEMITGPGAVRATLIRYMG